MTSRQCQVCGGDIPGRARWNAKFCSSACRQKNYRTEHSQGIPAELRERPRWVRYRLVRRGAKATKIPVQLDGQNASSTDPDTWSTYAQVRGFSKKGFVLNGDGIACIDLDDCVVDGQVVGKAAEIVASCPDTYVEISPSGTGVHIFGYGHLPQGRRLPGGVEIYADKRFICITGSRISRTSSLADISDVIAELV